MYLVVIRCSLDDVPYRLFVSLPEARAFAESLDTPELENLQILGSCSRPVGVCVVGFLDGVPAECDYIKSFAGAY